VCCGLYYERQAQSPATRAYLNLLEGAQKLRLALKADPSVLLPIPPRPKYMARARYIELVAALIVAEERLFAAYDAAQAKKKRRK
jgi:hypothetical protein